MAYKLGSGESVVDRNRSHLSLSVLHILPEALKKIYLNGEIFVRIRVDFDHVVGKNNLVATGPTDEIVWARRPNRWGFTRLVLNREPEDCASVVVILKKAEGNLYVLITAFIGSDVTYPEPWDKRAFEKEPDPIRAESDAREFWNNHALILEGVEIIPGTLTRECPW